MLIGIMGYARSGKNTFATLLSKIVGEGRTVTELSFAAKLKSELCTMLRAVGVDTSDIFLSKKELWRPMMVAWGKQRRTIYPNYWVDPVIKHYKKIMSMPTKGAEPICIITDVRYLNEAEAIKESGGLLVHIVNTKTREGAPANEEEFLSMFKITKSDLYDDVIKIENDCKSIQKLHNEAVKLAYGKMGLTMAAYDDTINEPEDS